MFKKTILPLLLALIFVWGCGSKLDTSGTIATTATVTAVTPLDGATNVSPNTAITATFSVPMDSASVTTSTFTLTSAAGSVVGTVSFSGSTATFQPNAPLSQSIRYTATLTTGIKDYIGAPLGSAYAWSFTTASTSSAPTVASTSPSSGATGVSVSDTVSATFSSAMNSSTINTSTFTLSYSGGSVTGTVGYSGTTATFTPASSLAASTVYTATLTTGIKDNGGTSLASNNTWTFTTGAPVTTVLYSTSIQPIFNMYCTSCHNNGGYLPNLLAGSSYANIVSQPSFNPSGTLVIPGNSASSVLYERVVGLPGKTQMPPGGALSASNQTLIKTWIDQGALNN